jgi:hypothetical protein
MSDRQIFLPGRKPPVKMGPKGTGPANGQSELEKKREAKIDLEAELDKRQALVDQDEAERILADKYDLVAMIAKDPACFPLEIAMWNILIEMVRPASKYGGVIQKTGQQLQAEEYLARIGRVILCGPSAMEGKTESGIMLKDLTATIKTPEQLIGKYVIQQPNTGADVWFAPLPGKRLKVISATEVLAVTTNPTMFLKP